jgi:hypothetical protein
MNSDNELRLYKITLSVKAGVAVNLPGHELTAEDAKMLAINSVKKLLKNCDIISVEELEIKNKS